MRILELRQRPETQFPPADLGRGGPARGRAPRMVEAVVSADLDRLMARADTIDKALLHAITQAGGQVEQYPDLDSFL